MNKSTATCKASSARSSARTAANGSSVHSSRQRVQTHPTRFRIPDICILRSSDPHDPIIRSAPYICTDAPSKDGTLMEIQTRTDEYRAMGVDYVWIVDPWLRKGYIASAHGFEHPVDGVFTIPGTPLCIELAALFAELDETYP